MGWSYAKLGDYRQALACCEEALALQHQLSDRRGQAHTLHSLGYAYHRLGHHQQAAACFEQALALQRELGSRYYQARVLDHLGDAQAAAGDLAGAHASWTEALHVFTQLAHPGTSQIHAKIQQLAIHPHESPAGS
jgi:tetratricopeptide (TPR) repeat protein